MNIMEAVRMALQNIWANKTRTILTMLGIIIGISAVITIVGMGNGMQIYTKNEFAKMGSNTLNVTIRGRGTSRTVSEADMYQLVADNSTLLSNLSPVVTVSGKVKIGTTEAKTTSVTGVSEAYFPMKSYKMTQGRALEYVDMTTRKDVCVVGNYVAQTYYDGDAVGKTIKIGQNTMTIIGVMEQQNKKMEKGGTDDAIFMPYSTAARIAQLGTLTSYVVSIPSVENASASKQTVENALYKVFRTEDAYTVMSMAQVMDMMNSMNNMMIMVLAVIAGISLVVGGIGIMNIMLVSVTERTREIGIRKALGAKERYIMEQFVIEAIVTSALGGSIGILFGYIFSAIGTFLIVALTGTELSIVPSVSSIVLAVGVSAAIGIIFGYLPAKKAARLNPIDALRYD